MSKIQKAEKIIKNWWLFLFLGLLFIGTGVWMLGNPLESYLGMVMFFSVILLASGVSEFIFAISNRESMEGWGWHLTAGLLDMAIGIILLINPGFTMVTLPFVLGVWLLFRSVALLAKAMEFVSYGFSNWGWLLFGGLLTGFLAIMIIFNPFAGAVSLVVWTIAGLMMFGVFTIVSAFQMKALKDQYEANHAEHGEYKFAN